MISISNATNRAYVFKVHDSAGGETERSAVSFNRLATVGLGVSLTCQNERDQGMTPLPFIPLNHLPSLLKSKLILFSSLYTPGRRASTQHQVRPGPKPEANS